MSVSEVLFGKMNLFFSLLAFFCHWDYSERKNSRVRVLLVLSPEMPLHIGLSGKGPFPGPSSFRSPCGSQEEPWIDSVVGVICVFPLMREGP